MEKKEVAVHAELLEIREEGKGKERMCRAKGKLMVLTPGNGNSFCLGHGKKDL